jgi:hypothetical protein
VGVLLSRQLADEIVERAEHVGVCLLLLVFDELHQPLHRGHRELQAMRAR